MFSYVKRTIREKTHFLVRILRKKVEDGEKLKAQGTEFSYDRMEVRK